MKFLLFLMWAVMIFSFGIVLGRRIESVVFFNAVGILLIVSAALYAGAAIQNEIHKTKGERCKTKT